MSVGSTSGSESAPPTGGPDRASMHDVAKLAGVSHTTVSRVLNGHPYIREETRQRVLQAVNEMNYTPSSIARAMVTKRTMRIGVLVDGPIQHAPNSTLRAFEIAARGRGYAVSTLSVDDDENHQIEAGAIELVGQGVDALCVISPRSSSLDRLRRHSLGLPILVLKDEPDMELHTAAVDQRGGAEQAMRHLIDLGHRSILHLAGPLDWYDARARMEAWRDVLAEEGLEIQNPAIGDWSSDSGYEFGRTHDFDGVTAVFVSNDQMALGLIHGLNERGLRVPEDISVVGFDDLPDTRHFHPPLTTVRQDFTALGEMLIDELIAIISSRSASHPRLIPPVLVVRASTAPPRGEAGRK